MSSYVYYMNSPSTSSYSTCFGFSVDHNQPYHGIALFGRAESRFSRDLGFSRAKSRHGRGLVTWFRHGLGLGSAEPSSIRLFSRLPRKEGQYYTTIFGYGCLTRDQRQTRRKSFWYVTSWIRGYLFRDWSCWLEVRDKNAYPMLLGRP